MRAIFFTYSFIIACVFSYSQHYPVYSQYMFNGLAINPAYAGSREVLSIVASSRNQWAGFEGAPKTQFLSAHLPMMKNRIGLGFQIINDKTGLSNNTSLQFLYAYRILSGKGSLAIGLSGSVQFISNKWDKIKTHSPGDIVFESNESFSKPNFGTGLYYLRENFYMGLSSPYILKFNNSFFANDTLNYSHVNLLFYGGFIKKISPNFKLKPSYLLKLYPEYSTQLDISCLIVYNDVIWTGLSLRTSDAIVWILEYQLSNKFRFGYAHDFTFSSLNNYSKGANEIFLLYEFGNKTNAQGIKFF
ncbi:MAG: type IX secretion system membrane protein PorP/SprF [Bacteroidota bacterium]